MLFDELGSYAAELRVKCTSNAVRAARLRWSFDKGWWSGLLVGEIAPAELRATQCPTRGWHEVAAAEPVSAPAKGGADSISRRLVREGFAGTRAIAIESEVDDGQSERSGA